MNAFLTHISNLSPEDYLLWAGIGIPVLILLNTLGLFILWLWEQYREHRS